MVSTSVHHQVHDNVIGRLAPSPTGVLHAGNARSLLLAWLSARAQGGRILLRIEDLLPDAEEHLDGLLRDLDWLGLDCDGPQPGDLWRTSAERRVDGRVYQRFLRQSDRSELYDALLRRLLDRGLVYPCVCTRKDIEHAARAPHAEDKGTPYPGTCRERFASEQAALDHETHKAAAEGRAPLGVALRLRVPTESIAFDDLLHGPCAVRLPDDSGDLVVRRKDGGFAYMFAVVVDDLAMGVTEVVRGDDLLDCTAQQLAVYRALAMLEPDGTHADADALVARAKAWTPPRHVHVPLVLGDDGRRLAKRNRSVHLQFLRESGVSAERFRRWLAVSVGLPDTADLGELVRAFAWERVPRGAVVFGAV